MFHMLSNDDIFRLWRVSFQGPHQSYADCQHGQQLLVVNGLSHAPQHILKAKHNKAADLVHSLKSYMPCMLTVNSE